MLKKFDLATKLVDSSLAMRLLKSNSNIWLHGIAATPTYLISEMCKFGTKKKLSNINIHHMHVEGKIPYVEYPGTNSFRCKTFFASKPTRNAISTGVADYIPANMSQIPKLLRSKVLPIDLCLVQVSPPCKNGFCSLGISAEATIAAVEKATFTIAQINPNMPRTFGDTIIHIDKFTHCIEQTSNIFKLPPKIPDHNDDVIASHIANNLVPDGSTLQVGIGSVPNLILQKLSGHKDLGIHSEMLTSGMRSLIENGIVTNHRKTLNTGKTCVAFVWGDDDLYKFIDNNQEILVKDVEYVNDVGVISRQPRMVSINSCIEIDLTGQVVSETVNNNVYSGIGGQADFVHGSILSHNGKSIFALQCQTKSKKRKIVTRVSGPVTTSRALVDYVVTEYGFVSLRGKSLTERAKLLISIAHPDHRKDLADFAKKHYNI